MAAVRRALAPVLLLLLLLPIALFATGTRLNLGREFPVAEAENRIWLGTPDGLLQYNPDDDSFRRFPLPVEGRSPRIEQLSYADEWLWCVLDRGLAALHVRLNEWLYFDAASGLPDDAVNGLDFQDAHVWVATGKGIARFDMLIEEWEVFAESQGKIVEILVEDENAWVIAADGFAEYSPRFEKWRRFGLEEDSAVRLSRAFLLEEELWLLSDRGLIRFDTELRTRRRFFTPFLQRENLLELQVEDGNVWSITRLGLYFYDREAETWLESEGNSYLQGATLVDACVDRGEIWVLTDRNLLMWDRTGKEWEVLDYASGLSASGAKAVYANGGTVFLLGPEGIDYRLGAGESWRRHAAERSAEERRGRHLLGKLLDDREGGSISLGEREWGWEGSHISLLRDYEGRFGDGEDHSSTASGTRLDVKSRLTLGEGRGVTGFFNDVDYGEVMYGARYRSREGGILREAGWGDFRRETADLPFGETASLFGGQVWLQSGPKTDRFKRSRVTLKSFSGERRSQKSFEHFPGTAGRSLIQLRHPNLVRGTEIVELDGVRVDGGNDYVLDYTSGTLVFVREGLVNADTRIEIEYEYYVDEGHGQAHGAAVDFSPHDDLAVRGDWVRLSRDETKAATDLLAVHGEARQRLGGYDLRIVPGVAFMPGPVVSRQDGQGGWCGTPGVPESDGAAAAYLEGLASSSRIRFRTRYERYAPDYVGFYRPQSLLGDVERRFELHTTADVSEALRLSGEWRSEWAVNPGSGELPTDRHGSLGFLLHPVDWPSWQLSYQDFRTETAGGVLERSALQNRWEYQLPTSWSRRFLLQRVDAEGFLRFGRLTETGAGGLGEEVFRQGHVRLRTDIDDRFRGSLFYRRGERDAVEKGDWESPISRLERLLFHLSHEKWRLAQLHLRLENRLDRDFHADAAAWDTRLDQFTQFDLRLSPGRLWERLSPLHFEFNINQSFFGRGATGKEGGGGGWLPFLRDTRRLEKGQVVRNFFIRNEFRPDARWRLFSLVEWNLLEGEGDGDLPETRSWRWSEKLDAKLGFKSRLNLQYREYSRNRRGGERIRYLEPTAWIQHRWTPNLQSVFNASFRRTHFREGEIRNLTHSWDGRCDLILRKNRLLHIRRLEVRQEFSGTRRHTRGDRPEQFHQLAASSSLHLYPLHSTIVRGQFQVAWQADGLSSEEDWVDVGLNLRLSLRF